MRAPAGLVVLIVLAGCVAPSEPSPPGAPEKLGTTETTRGTAIDFAVPAPVEGMRYVWTFGDGQSSLGATARHAWTTPGVYTVAWQEMRGSDVVRASTGRVRVHDPQLLTDTATPEAPSEVHFEVLPNASAVELRFRAPAGVGAVTVLLVDPSGAPVVTETLDLAEPADVALKARDPAPGSWFLYVERPDGLGVEWTVDGVVRYG